MWCSVNALHTVPARHDGIAGITSSTRGDRLVTVARSVASSSVAPSSARLRHRPLATLGVAVVLRREVVVVASAAAVHERATLGHLAIPVEP